MMAARRRKGRRRPSRQARIRRASAKLEKLIKGADARGYTGMLGSKGSLQDMPEWNRTMRAYDKACEIRKGEA
jgi:hypothetical protein